MESGEIINNSYKDFGEGTTNENEDEKNKSRLKKIIMISLIIAIVLASLTIFLIFYLLKTNEEKEKITCEQDIIYLKTMMILKNVSNVL